MLLGMNWLGDLNIFRTGDFVLAGLTTLVESSGKTDLATDVTDTDPDGPYLI